MIEEIKILLGSAAANFSDEQIGLALKQAMAMVCGYCNRDLDDELAVVAERIAIIYLNKTNTEGIVSQGYNGVSETYLDGFPADIKAILNRKRRIKVI